MKYPPVLYINDYWAPSADLIAINDIVNELPLSATYAPISVFYFQMYEAQKMQKQWNGMLGVRVGEASDDWNDLIIRTMLDTQYLIQHVYPAHSCTDIYFTT